MVVRWRNSNVTEAGSFPSIKPSASLERHDKSVQDLGGVPSVGDYLHSGKSYMFTPTVDDEAAQKSLGLPLA